MKQKLIILFLLFFSAALLAQVETVPAEHQVYPFLKKMHVEGFLQNYHDVILPLSKGKVIHFLTQLDSVSFKFNTVDREFLERMKEKFDLSDTGVNLFDDFPGNFVNNIFEDRRKNFYSYSDSSISFYINPVLEYSYIYSSSDKAGSSLLNPGGKAYGSYNNWLGFYLQGTNGVQFGNRDVARYDQDVEQSFTFNDTGLDYFDGTKGYIRFQKGIASLQLGRERILWGNGYINKLLLSNNPPLFDFIKFDIEYKSLSYNFIHGWLVMPPEVIYVDSLAGNVKKGNPKYFAISRLSFAPSNSLLFGISQVIVYSFRPFEAAYLNPFLFWESAQRSMNDMDNSMLTVDARWLITDGLEISAAAIFDDLDFSELAIGESIDNANGSAWHAGAFIAGPFMPKNTTLKIEYMQIMPYMFSHKGLTPEALTYTHDGYILGPDFQPNSVVFSSELDYWLSGKLNLRLKYNLYIHGNNVYDAEGNLIRNVGGNIFNNLSLYDSFDPQLLDGIREQTDEVSILLNYEITYGFYFNLLYKYIKENLSDFKGENNIIRAGIRMDFE